MIKHIKAMSINLRYRVETCYSIC